MNDGVVKEFHQLFYHSRVWTSTRWLGVQVLKYPSDLLVYQEIIYELRPDWIVECGTFHGGSAFFMASICDLIAKGNILTIDIDDHPDRPQHPRIQYLKGASTSPEIVDRVKREIGQAETVMVILDSDHSRENVKKELELYSRIVTVGSYLIVEDTNINGHPVYPEFGPGPMEAVGDFLADHHDRFVGQHAGKVFHHHQSQRFFAADSLSTTEFR